MPLQPRHRSWTDQETEKLRLHIARGGSAARAAVIFRRTQGAVRAHAASCGLKFPTISELRRRASGVPAPVAPVAVTPSVAAPRAAIAQAGND